MRHRSIALAGLAAAVAGLAAAVAGLFAGRRHRRPGSGTGRSAVSPSSTRALAIARDVFCLGPTGRTQTNVYFVRSGTTWVLVDAGWAGDAALIEATARSLIGPGAAPAAIVLTHVHPDHAGSARALAEAWRCPILLHPGEVAIANGDFASMERFAGPLDRWVVLPAMRAIGERRRTALLARGSLAGVLRELEPDGTIPGLDGWRWLATPGHAPGHVALVRTIDRVVLTGDALVTLRVNDLGGILLGRQGLSAPPRYTTWDPGAAAASIATIAAVEPTVIGSGHGRPMAGPGTVAAVRAFAERAAASRTATRPEVHA